jgi:osmotically inducible protein OsmC
MKTHGTAVWQGGIKDGKGAISTKSGALKDYPYGFSSEALSLILGEAKLTAERMETTRPKSRSKKWPTASPLLPCT